MRRSADETTPLFAATIFGAIAASSGLAADLCIGPSATNGLNVTVDCQGGAQAAHRSWSLLRYAPSICRLPLPLGLGR